MQAIRSVQFHNKFLMGNRLWINNVCQHPLPTQTNHRVQICTAYTHHRHVILKFCFLPYPLERVYGNTSSKLQLIVSVSLFFFIHSYCDVNPALVASLAYCRVQNLRTSNIVLYFTSDLSIQAKYVLLVVNQKVVLFQSSFDETY